MNYSSVIDTGSFIYQILTFIGVIFTATIAITSLYYFFFKRKDILLKYNLLLNYSFQMSQNELLGKIRDLTTINADKEPMKASEILLDIQYQMKGNPILSIKCKPILTKLSKFEKHPDLITNGSKIALIAQLKEQIKYINLKSYNELLGDKKDE